MKQARPLRRVVIKEEFIALTGDYVSAILLSQIEYWTKRSYDFDKFMAEEKDRAANEGKDIGAPLLRGWIYKTAEELSSETMMNLSANTIRSRLKKLVESDWIGERSNPEYRWDRTKQYRFNALQVANDLENLGYHLDSWVLREDGSEPGNPCGCATANFEDRTATAEDRTETAEDRSNKNFGAVPEITPEITPETTAQQACVAAADNSCGLSVTPWEVRQLIDYATSNGIELKNGYAGSYLTRAGGMAGAKKKIDDAVAFIAREHSNGKQIENVVGVLEHVMLCDSNGARLTHDPISKRQRRMDEKEKKYADVYIT